MTTIPNRRWGLAVRRGVFVAAALMVVAATNSGTTAAAGSAADMPPTAGAAAEPLLTAGSAADMLLASVTAADPPATAGVGPSVRPGAGSPVLGVNADLTQYDADELGEILDIIARSGLEAVRLPVRWSEIEPEQGSPDWTKLDDVMAGLGDRGLQPLLAIGTAPEWSRRDPHPEPNLWLCDDETVTGPEHAASSPPTDPADLARFAAAVAGRYGDDLWAIEVWPEPNLLPNWRATGPDPEEYGATLLAVSEAIRAADDDVLIVSGALAPTTDVGVCYLSDVVFLDRLARTGALEDVDAVAIEPFGLRSGPDSAAADREVLDFSRPVVLRDVLDRHGVDKPLWASAWGWVGLPGDWSGDESPWGRQDPETAAEWTRLGYSRARAEWPWMGPMFVWLLQPHAAADDPEWGYALLDPDGNRTAAWDAVAALAAGEVPAWSGVEGAGAAPADSGPMGWVARVLSAVGLAPDSAPMAVVVLLLVVAVGAGIAWALRSRVRRAFGPPLVRLQESNVWVLVGAFAVSAVAAAVGPWPVSLIAVPLMIAIATADIRVSIAAVAAATPLFYRVAIWMGPRQMGPVEALLLIAVAGALLRAYLGEVAAVAAYDADGSGGDGAAAHMPSGAEPTSSAIGLTRRLTDLATRLAHAMRPLDWVAVALVAWAALTPLWAEHPAPAIREWRTVIAEPVVFYFLLRTSADRRRAAQAAVDGLVAGGSVAALWALAGVGLFASGLGSTAVVAEGVLRANGPYNSPNNLALFLGRLVPVLVAFGLWGGGRRRRLYLAAGVPIALALLATFSRSALVVGLPVTALYLLAVAVYKRGRVTARPFVVAAVAAGAAAAALLPFANTTRIRGTFDIEPGSTLFIRLRLWESALEMARDHPLLGVGLDNFLYLYRDRYVQRDAVQERFLNHPHNAVLDWWTRLGLPGLLLLASLSVGNVVAGARAIKRSSGTLLALAAGALGLQIYALAHGTVDNVFFLVDLAVVWWIGQAALLAILDRD